MQNRGPKAVQYPMGQQQVVRAPPPQQPAQVVRRPSQPAKIKLSDRVAHDLTKKAKNMKPGETIDLAAAAKFYKCDVGFIIQVINDLLQKGTLRGSINHSTLMFILGS